MSVEPNKKWLGEYVVDRILSSSIQPIVLKDNDGYEVWHAERSAMAIYTAHQLIIELADFIYDTCDDVKGSGQLLKNLPEWVKYEVYGSGK